MERCLQPPDTFDPLLYKYARNAFAAAPEPDGYGAPHRLAGTEGPLQGEAKEKKRDDEKGE